MHSLLANFRLLELRISILLFLAIFPSQIMDILYKIVCCEVICKLSTIYFFTLSDCIEPYMWANPFTVFALNSNKVSGNMRCQTIITKDFWLL